MSDSNGTDLAQAVDTPSVPAANTPPSDLAEIIASLDAEEASQAPEEASQAQDSDEIEAQVPASADEAAEQAPASPSDTVAHDAEESTSTAETASAETAVVANAETVAEAGTTESADAPSPSGLQTENLPATPLPVRRVASWPFVAYFLVWVVLAGFAGWFLTQEPPGAAVYGSELYSGMVLGGLVLTLAGPALILATWSAAMLHSRGASRAGLFTNALLKGALATFGGVAIWWAMLMIVDTLRLGRPV